MKRMFPQYAFLTAGSILLLGVCAAKYNSPSPNHPPDGPSSESFRDFRGDIRTASSPPERWFYDTMPVPAPSKSPVERLNEISFQYNSSALDRQGIAICRQMATQIKAMTGRHVMIVGFSQDRERDKSLGLHRAEQVHRYMTGLGIDPARLESTSFKSTLSRATDAAYAHRMRQDQSVEIWIL